MWPITDYGQQNFVALHQQKGCLIHITEYSRHLAPLWLQQEETALLIVDILGTKRH